MKAAKINTFGGVEVITIDSNSDLSELKPNQIKIKNQAASINAIDWKIMAGYMQPYMPVTLPITLGGDFAGEVVELGQEVTEFKIGDEVYGQAIVLNGGSGTVADTVIANTKNTATKPASTTFIEAAALPLAGVSALQALKDHIKLQAGQKILIHGGAGGVGHLAIQIAKSMGAVVATTVKSSDVEFAKNLGADQVIDYTSQKFEEILHDFDAVFDTVGGNTADKSFAVLRKGGVIVSMAGQPNPELAAKSEVTAIGQFTQTDTAHLDQLAKLVDMGQVKAHVDKVFLLNETKNAFDFQMKTHPQGKVIITTQPK